MIPGTSEKNMSVKSLFAVATASLAAVLPALADDVRVIGTGAVQHSVLALSDAFQKATGHRIVSTFGTAGAVSARFKAGESADVLISSTGGVRDIAATGKLASGEMTPVGKVRIGIGVCNGGAKPETSTPAALRTALLAAPAFAYGDPASGATTGVHFAKVLTELAIADQVKGKALLRDGGLNVMKEVASGKAAFGVTQTSEIIAIPGCEIAGYLPDSMQLVTTYAAALTKEAKTPAARAFIDFVVSAPGREIFKKEGFEPAQ
jgi:molybdate transport system substrate-binding protein